MTKRQTVLACVALVVLSAAGWIALAKTRDSSAIGKDKRVDGVCLACKSSCSLVVPPADPGPYKCPKCSKSAVYTWLVCNDCNKRFVPNPVVMSPGEPPRLPIYVNCPNCNGVTCIPYNPKFHDPTSGDLPLPQVP